MSSSFFDDLDSDLSGMVDHEREAAGIELWEGWIGSRMVMCYGGLVHATP